MFCTFSQASESAWSISKNSSYLEITPEYITYSKGADQFQQLNFLSRLEIGWFERSTLSISVPFKTINQHTFINESDVVYTNNGLTDLFLGSQYQLVEYPFSLAVKAGVKIPSGYDILFIPSIGDRQMDLDMGILTGYYFDFFPAFVQAGAAYKFRTNYDPNHPLVREEQNFQNEIVKPADQISFLVEAGAWIFPALYLGINSYGNYALEQEKAYQQSSLHLRPIIAVRFNQYIDLSFQYDQTLWAINSPSSTGVLLGLHLHYGGELPRGVGLRGTR